MFFFFKTRTDLTLWKITLINILRKNQRKSHEIKRFCVHIVYGFDPKIDQCVNAYLSIQKCKHSLADNEFQFNKE